MRTSLIRWIGLILYFAAFTAPNPFVPPDFIPFASATSPVSPASQAGAHILGHMGGAARAISITGSLVFTSFISYFFITICQRSIFHAFRSH
jgi:hypothetical protein